MTEIFIVGHDGPEHNHIESLHQTQEGALKAWNDLRLELIKDAEVMLEFCKEDGKNFGTEIYSDMIKKLRCDNPDEIDNYPHETPYIQKWEVKE